MPPSGPERPRAPDPRHHLSTESLTTMNPFTPLTPDDPRLTAYALGELEGDEQAAVAAALAADPALQATVDEIRATAGRLEAALAAEPMPDLPVSDQRAAIVAGRDPWKLDGGPLRKLARFPQAYYIIGGLAAAVFAILVVRNEPRVHSKPAGDKYAEIALPVSADAAAKVKTAEEPPATAGAMVAVQPLV